MGITKMNNLNQAMKNADAALEAEKIVSHPAYDRQAHAKKLTEIQNAPAANLAALVEKTESLLRGATAALQNLEARYQVETESLSLRSAVDAERILDRIKSYEKAIAELAALQRSTVTDFEVKQLCLDEKYLKEASDQEKIIQMLKQSLKVGRE